MLHFSGPALSVLHDEHCHDLTRGSYHWQNSMVPPTVIDFSLITGKLNFIEIGPTLDSLLFTCMPC